MNKSNMTVDAAHFVASSRLNNEVFGLTDNTSARPPSSFKYGDSRILHTSMQNTELY